MNKQSSEIRFGAVRWFNESDGEGQLDVRGESQEVWFEVDTIRDIIAGETEPVFGTGSPDSFTMPQVGAQVVFLLQIGYEPFESGPARGVRRFVEVVAWNYSFHYNDIRKQISTRPIYRVMEYRFIGGDPVSVNQNEEIARGTAAELEARYPRSANEDPLAPETRFLEVSKRHVFHRVEGRKPTEKYSLCDDPRPLPKGAVAVPSREVNHQGLPLATAADIATLTIGVTGAANPVNPEGEPQKAKVLVFPGPSPESPSTRELEELAAGAGGKLAGKSIPRPRQDNQRRGRMQ